MFSFAKKRSFVIPLTVTNFFILKGIVFTKWIIFQITTYDTADELYFRQRFCLDSLGVLVTFGDYRTCEYRAEGLGVRKILYGPPNDFTDELITRLTTDLMFPREGKIDICHYIANILFISDFH